MVLMKTKIKKYLKELIGFIVVLAIVSNIVSFYRSSDLHVNNTICEGGSDIVYIWGTWCPVCKVQSPNIEFLSHYYKVKTIVVSSGSDQDIQKYLQKNNFSFQFINDENATLTRKNGVKVFPTIVTCKDKKVYYADVGYTSTVGLLLRLWL